MVQWLCEFGWETGTEWTATAHIITAVIGAGVLSLAWAMAQLGWLIGLTSLLAFAVVTLYTANLLTDCYRSPDPVTGKRNYSYMEAVKNILGMHIPNVHTLHVFYLWLNYIFLSIKFSKLHHSLGLWKCILVTVNSWKIVTNYFSLRILKLYCYTKWSLRS